MKLIPYGIADYKKIIEVGRAYVDKTMYIRSLEYADDYILFLRPWRFGKSLFASMLGYYYDIAQKDNFELLFSGTDIGQNPTHRKNSYYILKFNFSDVETSSDEILLESFTGKVYDALLGFRNTYKLDFTLEKDRPAEQLTAFFTEFQRISDGKIYVIIDEYDNFANLATPRVGEKTSPLLTSRRDLKHDYLAACSLNPISEDTTIWGYHAYSRRGEVCT